MLGWYRIPLKSAPKTVAVDWLAFYQTAKFGEEKWAINTAALLKVHKLLTRSTRRCCAHHAGLSGWRYLVFSKTAIKAGHSSVVEMTPALPGTCCASAQARG